MENEEYFELIQFLYKKNPTSISHIIGSSGFESLRITFAEGVPVEITLLGLINKMGFELYYKINDTL